MLICVCVCVHAYVRMSVCERISSICVCECVCCLLYVSSMCVYVCVCACLFLYYIYKYILILYVCMYVLVCKCERVTLHSQLLCFASPRCINKTLSNTSLSCARACQTVCRQISNAGSHKEWRYVVVAVVLGAFVERVRLCICGVHSQCPSKSPSDFFSASASASATPSPRFSRLCSCSSSRLRLLSVRLHFFLSQTFSHCHPPLCRGLRLLASLSASCSIALPRCPSLSTFFCLMRLYLLVSVCPPLALSPAHKKCTHTTHPYTHTHIHTQHTHTHARAHT